MSYTKDLGRVRKCGCKNTKDVDPTAGTVMAGVAAESTAISTARPAIANQGMSTPVGAQPAFTTKELLASSEEPAEEPSESEEDEAVEAEKSVGDRIRQQRDSRDPHKKNFLSAFYASRALERSKRAK